MTGSVESIGLTNEDPIRIAYQGPLGRQRFLKLDIVDDELVLDSTALGLLPRWADLPENTEVCVYPLSEIAGEKLRCIMQRMQCRDLFDLWVLFEDAGVDPQDAAEIFRPKAEHKQIDPDRFETSYRARLEQYRGRWANGHKAKRGEGGPIVTL